MGTVDVGGHIRNKSLMGELAPEVAERMLALLSETPDMSYARLLESATCLPIPSVVYHSAPTRLRDDITSRGLRIALPADGKHGANASGQPRGVYVSPQPDLRGVWAQENAWDIWEVAPEGLPYEHDRLNVGNWVITEDVPSSRLALFASRSWDLSPGGTGG